MRSRSLKPGFFKNELLGSADPLYGQLFQGLWLMADREGRLKDNPLRICAELFPYRRRVTEKKANAMLQWLHENSFIVRYEIEGRRYIQVSEFLEHQNPHQNEAPSKIPALSVVSHGASTGAEVDQAPEQHGAGTGVAPEQHSTTRASSLTPSSLTPDSLFSGSQSTRFAPEARPPVRNGEDPVGLERIHQLKAIYPKGIYRQADWLLAEREIHARLEEDATWEEITGGVRRYAAQCEATGNAGTQFVTAPSKFVKDRLFREPFPLPANPGRRSSIQDYDREAAERLAAAPGDDPGPM